MAVRAADTGRGPAGFLRRHAQVRMNRLLLAALAASLVPAILLLVAAAGIELPTTFGPQNRKPVALGDVASTRVGVATLIDVVANDRDADREPLVVESVTGRSAAGGTVVLGANLLENGDGAAGDANFTAFDYVPAAGPQGLAAFVTDQVPPVLGDQLVPVEPSHVYSLSAWSRADPNVGATHSIGLASYDADGEWIEAHHVLYARGSETVLAADLAPGDEEIRLEDATGWLNGAEAPGHHNVVLYPYVSESGIEYDTYTYSRHVDAIRGDAEGLWDAGAIVDDVVTLNRPWDRPNPGRPDGVWPAGTPVANARPGDSFNLALARLEPYTADWVRLEGKTTGVGTGGLVPPGRFPPGTAAARLVVLPNRGGTGSTAWYADFRLVDESAPRYRPPAGFVGIDSFDYTVADGSGGASSATVTVSVIRNNEPVAIPDGLVAAPGASAALDPLANDRDGDGDALTLVALDKRSARGGQVAVDPNLVRNGAGELGSNVNFSAFDFVPGAGPDGNGAFATEPAIALSDLPIPVDTSHAYELSAASRGDPDTGGVQLMGFAAFDATDERIAPYHVQYAPGSETRLAADLAPGDRIIELEDASGWRDGDEPGVAHNIVMYPYTAPDGTTYPPYTYSRHTTQIRRGTAGLWGVGGIAGNTVTLLEPWNRPNPGRADGVWPARTPVANAQGGEAYNFALVRGGGYSREWTTHTATIEAVGSGGLVIPEQFPPGTAFVRFVVAAGRGGGVGRSFYANVSLHDLDAPPVVYTPPPSFTGTDTFTYEIEDGFGGRATGTVTVTVGP